MYVEWDQCDLLKSVYCTSSFNPLAHAATVTMSTTSDCMCQVVKQKMGHSVRLVVSGACFHRSAYIIVRPAAAGAPQYLCLLCAEIILACIFRE